MPGAALSRGHPDAFGRRLEQAGGAVAVALSGGADSMLALRLTLDWARPLGRPVAALIVDHGLQAQSAAWSRFAADAATGLGAAARILRWESPHTGPGLPAAARLARHRLLAAAAREAGARVIVTGHTGSDAAENLALGQGRLTEWSPSPVWPHGRGLFLLRPLLDMSRRAVRERLRAEGVRWIDDPANSDERQPRVRTRLSLGDDALASAAAADPPFAARARFANGAIVLPREGLHAASRVLAAAAVCAGGGGRLPAGWKVQRLAARLASPGAFTASLVGALIEAGAEEVAIYRNAGDIGRTGGAGLVDGVWDGRFAAAQDGPVPLRGHAARLPPAERAALALWPARARGSLPVILSQDGSPTCPVLARDGERDWRWLVPDRFAAACGLIAREGQL